MSQTLHIKHMVCDRCVRTVRHTLQAQDLTVEDVQLGEATVAHLPEAKLPAIQTALHEQGFELLSDPKAQLVERMKLRLLAAIRGGQMPEIRIKLSEWLAHELDHDYTSLATLFREVQNTTLEKWVILQKVEYARELLAYGELPIKEIAYQLAYSSVAHFSNQFRQVTGFTPAEFRKLKSHPRHALHAI